MATHETNLKAVFTLVDRMSPALKQMKREMRVAGREMRSGFAVLCRMGLRKAAGMRQRREGMIEIRACVCAAATDPVMRRQRRNEENHGGQYI